MPELVPQPHGGALLTGGVPGHKGGPGRPPLRLVEKLKSIREDPDAQDALHTAAKDTKDPGFTVAWRLATDYDPEKPGQKHMHQFPDLSDEQMAERVMNLLKVAAKRRKEQVGDKAAG